MTDEQRIEEGRTRNAQWRVVLNALRLFARDERNPRHLRLRAARAYRAAITDRSLRTTTHLIPPPTPTFGNHRGGHYLHTEAVEQGWNDER